MAGAVPVTPLAGHVAAYLQIRRALGYQLVDHERLLIDFAARLEAAGQDRITVDAALAWATGPRPGSRRQAARRLSVVRRFAGYVAVFDPATEVPPTSLLPDDTTRTPPYIYTPGQVTALMAAAARLSPPLHAASYATLIGLMAATGLRTGEARRLDRDDVDLRTATLLVRDSKFGKTRQVPVEATTVAALTRYARRRDRLCTRPADAAFLLSAAGGRLDRRAVGVTFHGLLCDVGITAAAGQRAPRLYDLRHTFAVSTLTSWHAAGVDVDRRLPALSTYLGHLNPANTYWYLEAVPQLMTVVADRLQHAREQQS